MSDQCEVRARRFVIRLEHLLTGPPVRNEEIPHIIREIWPLLSVRSFGMPDRPSGRPDDARHDLFFELKKSGLELVLMAQGFLSQTKLPRPFICSDRYQPLA